MGGLAYFSQLAIPLQIKLQAQTFRHGRIMKDLQKYHAVSAVKSDNLGGSSLVLTAMIFDILLKCNSFSALTGIVEINEMCNPLCRWEGIR